MPREIVFPPRDTSMVVPHWPAASPDLSPGIAGARRQAVPGLLSGAPSLSPAPSGAMRRTPQPSAAAPLRPLALARNQVPAAAVVSRIVADAASTASQPSVQTSVAPSGSTTLGGLTATPIVQRVDGAAPAAPSEEGRSDSELDELARALFGRIRTHLRAEVIHEREAKGLTFDAF
jgi:hypothetical protein